MFYLLINYNNPKYFVPMGIYITIDDGIAGLIDCYMYLYTNNLVLKRVKKNKMFKSGIISHKYKSYHIRKINKKIVIYNSERETIHIDDYPETKKRLEVLRSLFFYDKKSLKKICKEQKINIPEKTFINKKNYLTTIYYHNLNEYNSKDLSNSTILLE